MVIKTPRLLIRPVVRDDWKSIREIWEDFSLSEYSRYDRPRSTEPEEVRLRIAKWAEANSGRDHMFFAVCREDAVMGYIALNRRSESYELGYCFHSRYARKGYAKESHLALFDYVKCLGIKKLTAGTALRNLPSVALLRSLGFRQTGTEKVSFYQDSCGNDLVFDGGIFQLEL